MLWYDARETGGATERLAFECRLRRGRTTASRFDGLLRPETDGTKILRSTERSRATSSRASPGAVRQEGSSGQLNWAGEAYHALTIDVTDGMMPIWRRRSAACCGLNVSGDCYVDGGGADYSCFEGFDCVLITGEGSLRFENTAGLECGGGTLPVPAVVVDGDVDVCCENFSRSRTRAAG